MNVRELMAALATCNPDTRVDLEVEGWDHTCSAEVYEVEELSFAVTLKADSGEAGRPSYL